MIKYTHIDGLHIVGRYGKEFVKEPVKFRGTVKLHGTNSSVTCTSEELLPQSRNRRLSLKDDNAGFAAFILDKVESKVVRELEDVIRSDENVRDDVPVTIYGEWIGPGIQNGVAITKLADRRWVVFAAKVGSGDDGRYVDIGEMDEFQQILWDYEGGIFSIFEAPTAV